MELESMKQAVILALEDIKAKDIAVLNVSHLTSMTDYMIIASGDSNRQTRALANNVQVKLKELGAEVLGVEGEESGEWVLVDLGQVVVHVMQPSTREHYNLEQLWGGVEAARRHSQKIAS
ncbi:MAG: ribosome silencing factor [Sulfurimicrobium sp.]|jgi:ribosome-associated protein|nr:ribosome silencing factor [Sulfurimicrobium sp.]MDO9188895.1 ribosome silencing factor [Sulfurimicrobium sp.]MDP1704835.1 ribosome silencing factor [Sulfurimicrobium sp.]MDP2198342.1 ribosome silencing factor [Sulfurimicrobium sp.]MDP2963642.1 ribosome silencing factor [Sulfurimicrobium sp.]